MDAVERENADRQKRWAKEQKVGEGTYAVVYKGLLDSSSICQLDLLCAFRKRSCDWSQNCHQENQGWTVQGWSGHVGHSRGEIPS